MSGGSRAGGGRAIVSRVDAETIGTHPMPPSQRMAFSAAEYSPGSFGMGFSCVCHFLVKMRQLLANDGIYLAGDSAAIGIAKSGLNHEQESVDDTTGHLV
jgi:hypothetical protein